MDWLISTWYGILTIVLVSLLVVFLLSLIPVLYRKFFKRLYDFTLSLIAIVCLSPVFLILIPTVAIGMKGNPFFTQKRPGKNEKIFKMFKFRTMTNEKDKDGNLLPDDVRLTKFGKFLRSTSLDELPELFNILIGNMSIVGPRPLLIKDMVFMSDDVRRRHTVRPGLTGLAQANGRNAISWEQKYVYDLDYIKDITFINDIKIILLTVLKVVKKEDVVREGTESDIDYGDWLLQENMITKEEYDNKINEYLVLRG